MMNTTVHAVQCYYSCRANFRFYIKGSHMIIVTGGARVLSAAILLKALNDEGYTDILVVDNLKRWHKIWRILSILILSLGLYG